MYVLRIMEVSTYVYMSIYEIAHNRAIRPCHLSRSIPLAWILPRGSMVLVTKTSDRARQRVLTLSTCTILT